MNFDWIWLIGSIIIAKLNLLVWKTDEVSLVQTYTLKKWLRKFKERGYKATFGKMKQLHDRICFCPIHPSSMTPQERKKALESLIFLTEKRDGQIKAQTCANGSTQQEYMTKEDSASPTTALESVLSISTINAKENRDIGTVDIPNAFIQTDIPQEDSKEQIII